MTDYVMSFKLLKRPLRHEEYAKFINDKEVTLCLFFQKLKEYKHKMTRVEGVNLDLFFLLKSCNSTSICDIFDITNNFSLKFNIISLIREIPFYFDVKEKIKTLESDHFQKLCDILSLYTSNLNLLWIDFSNPNHFFSIKFEPKVLGLDNKNNFIFTKIKVQNQVSLVHLEEEFRNYSKICGENKVFEFNPNSFQEYIAKILREKHPNLNFDFKILEEIKLIANFFYFDNIEDNKFKEKHFYFAFLSAFSNEIIMSRNLFFYNKT